MLSPGHCRVGQGGVGQPRDGSLAINRRSHCCYYFTGVGPDHREAEDAIVVLTEAEAS